MATAAKSETSLNAALVAAQGELRAPTKNRTVKVRSDKGSYSFDYATLDAIVEDVLRPVLPKHGLWFVQLCHDGQMVTRIIHENGEAMDCGVPMPNLPAKPQEAGSLISYFKRYSLCAAFGLVAEEDDDGNVAQGNGYEVKNGKAANNNAGRIDDAQYATLVTLMENKRVTTKRFCGKYEIERVTDLPARLYDDAVASLNAVEVEAA